MKGIKKVKALMVFKLKYLLTITASEVIHNTSITRYFCFLSDKLLRKDFNAGVIIYRPMMTNIKYK